MEWIYISPHLDDAALSCGGLIWDQTQAKETVSIWTICAGDPPPGPFSGFAQSLHERWETGPQAVSDRRSEDIASCGRLGAVFRHFDIPDCIYRRAPGPDGDHLYAAEESLNGPLHPAEMALVREIGVVLRREIPPSARLVCPLSLGDHVDHQLTRAAIEGLGIPVWYYADYPYVLRRPADLSRLAPPGWDRVLYPVSPAGLLAWQESIAAHTSQISTFWSGVEPMKSAIADYNQQTAGIPLWRPPG